MAPGTPGSNPGPWPEPGASLFLSHSRCPSSRHLGLCPPLPGAAAPPSFLLQAPPAFHTQLKCQPLGANHVSLLCDHVWLADSGT